MHTSSQVAFEDNCFSFVGGILVTPFIWYAASSTLSASATCITSNNLFSSSMKFFGSSVILEPVKLGGFILKSSRILEVSTTSCRLSLVHNMIGRNFT
ncbi:hypothetical protein H5410_050380 [Solanum commersonii]|uniref:Uncharacterized protein n=1 Tax=Solanum commersonii TaxID=4109 RepID=A0A9J5WVC4_SOLCO|nr:hypothetical protein H5410_050380 [Solanum commersonii]